MGENSPLGMLLNDDGKCLLFGLDYRTNTFHHYVEQVTGCACINPRTEVCTIRLPDGREVEGRAWGWRDGACYFTDTGRYGELMEERKLHKKAFIGDCEVTVFTLRDCFNVVKEVLDNGIDMVPACRFCDTRPYVTDVTKETDWDSINKCLHSWSESLKY